MAANTTLNAKNLETLGAQRLAELLMEVSKGSAAAKRRLRVELAGSIDSAEVARQVTKRLSSIERSRSRITWRRVKSLKADLEIQRRTIVDNLAKDDPEEALEVMWRFIGLARPVLARCSDTNGTIASVFSVAIEDLADIAAEASPNPVLLADRAFALLQEDDLGLHDQLIGALAPVLGDDGLEHLKDQLLRLAKLPVEQPDDPEAKAFGNPGEVDDLHRRKSRGVARALELIADAQGDVDAYIVQQGEIQRRQPLVAAEIGRRLLAAGRAGEAIEALDSVRAPDGRSLPFAWQAVRADSLETIGQVAEAQAFRWLWFRETLEEGHLRPYLKRLADFDDLEAEELAIKLALEFPDIHKALAFLIDWPSLPAAAALVARRFGELDGEQFELLARAADALGNKYPNAAILLYHAAIDFALQRGRSGRYRVVAQHLEECRRLADRSGDTALVADHQLYIASLRSEHEKRRAFWKFVT